MNLVNAGILIKTREANLTYYQANSHSPVFHALQLLIERTAGMSEAIRVVLLPLEASIERAFLYGSVAKGEERSESDVDLMVVGKASYLEIVSAVSPLQEQLGRDVNPTVFTKDEFRQRIRRGDRFLSRVMSEPIVDLIGGSHDA